MTRFLILLAIGLSLIALPAFGKTVAVTVEKENFRKSPNGKILATVKKGTRFEVIGERGRWWHVQLNGWIWRPKPVVKEEPAQEEGQTTDQKPVAAVELLDQKLEWFPQDFHRSEPPKRAHLRVSLWFKNNIRYTLSAIQYQLELVNRNGKVLYNEEVDRDIAYSESSQRSHSVHLFIQRGGPSGELYRQLKATALKRGLELRVTLKSAFFTETGEKLLKKADTP